MPAISCADAGNLLRRPDIVPLAVEMLLKFEEFAVEERTPRETTPEAPRSARWLGTA